MIYFLLFRRISCFYILPFLVIKKCTAAQLETCVWLLAQQNNVSAHAAGQSRCFSSFAILLPKTDYFSILIRVKRFFRGFLHIYMHCVFASSMNSSLLVDWSVVHWGDVCFTVSCVNIEMYRVSARCFCPKSNEV